MPGFIFLIPAKTSDSATVSRICDSETKASEAFSTVEIVALVAGPLVVIIILLSVTVCFLYKKRNNSRCSWWVFLSHNRFLSVKT